MVSVVAPQSRKSSSIGLSVLAVDQALYSGSNFVLATAAARRMTEDEFGRFALIILILSIMANLGKAVWHEPDLAREATGFGPSPAQLAMAGLLGFGLVLVAQPLALTVGGVLVVVAQDRLRFQGLAVGRWPAVMAADLVWFVISLAAFLAPLDGAGLLALWSGGAMASMIVLIAALTQRHPPGSIAVPVRLRAALLIDFALFTGMTQLGAVVVGFTLAAAEFAGLRAAVIVFGPIGVLTGAVTTWIFATSGAVERPARRVLPIAILLAGFCVIVAGLAMVMPPRVGAVAFGASWPDRLVLASIGLSVAAQALATPAMMLLRLSGRLRRLLTARLVAFCGFMVLVNATALLAGRAGPVAMMYVPVNLGLAVAAWRRVLEPQAR
ncbi:MAG: hypothetical protein OER95_17085 [Acidimicrobiia bacterium]|nr:hypothetical protein [Acidimicrobiia bacterium]